MGHATRSLRMFAGSFGLWIAVQSTAGAVDWYHPFTESSHPDVFYNYYVPGAGDGTPAAMYPAPHPTPPHVGASYYTYQPFMPQEHLYKHRYTHHQYYNRGMGLNRTKVSWYPAPRTVFRNAYYNLFYLPR